MFPDWFYSRTKSLSQAAIANGSSLLQQHDSPFFHCYRYASKLVPYNIAAGFRIVHIILNTYLIITDIRTSTYANYTAEALLSYTVWPLYIWHQNTASLVSMHVIFLEMHLLSTFYLYCIDRMSWCKQLKHSHGTLYLSLCSYLKFTAWELLLRGAARHVRRRCLVLSSTLCSCLILRSF